MRSVWGTLISNATCVSAAAPNDALRSICVTTRGTGNLLGGHRTSHVLEIVC